MRNILKKTGLEFDLFIIKGIVYDDVFHAIQVAATYYLSFMLYPFLLHLLLLQIESTIDNKQ